MRLAMETAWTRSAQGTARSGRSRRDRLASSPDFAGSAPDGPGLAIREAGPKRGNQGLCPTGAAGSRGKRPYQPDHEPVAVGPGSARAGVVFHEADPWPRFHASGPPATHCGGHEPANPAPALARTDRLVATTLAKRADAGTPWPPWLPKKPLRWTSTNPNMPP